MEKIFKTTQKFLRKYNAWDDFFCIVIEDNNVASLIGFLKNGMLEKYSDINWSYVIKDKFYHSTVIIDEIKLQITFGFNQ